MDSISAEKRSWVMSRIRAKDTKPEMIVRRLLHGLGFRYRLHRADLPGSPDLVFPSRKAAILVHGCFWHQHEGCRNARMPKSRLEFWGPKLQANKARDTRKLDELRRAGWRALVIWECELVDMAALQSRLVRFLEDDDAGS